MILTLNTKFEGYTPVKVLSRRTSYREVYLAKNDYEQDAVLTVYDMNNLPECYNGDKIPEFEIIPQLTNEAFPAYIERGNYNNGDTSLQWMTTKYVGHTTLSEYILSEHVCTEREILQQFYNLLVAVKELSWRIGNGCHNNISTDNIIVACNSNGEMRWHLRGLCCAAKGCRGYTPFDIMTPTRRFMAPEAFFKYHNIKTDIFSLGMVLATALQKTSPWEDLADVTISTPQWVKHICSNSPTLRLSEPLKSIVEKAIATKPSERLNSIEEFGTLIAKCLDEKNLAGFECFTPTRDKHTTASSKATWQTQDLDNRSRHANNQPIANVRIERAKGNGFKDVAGMELLKSKLQNDFIDIVRNRTLAEQFQITPPNGILLYGPPGTGKSYISRKLAEESGMLYCYIKPSDLGNIYIHGSQSMIADLFARSEELAAKNNCGVLLVFDEFDSLVPKRSAGDNNNQANEVAEFLTQLNDCAKKNVYVVATTNRINAICPAILRKGRIDEMIYVGLPDDEARKSLFIMEIEKRPHGNIDIDRIVALTKGYTSSDISYIVTECARRSFQQSIMSKRLVKIEQSILEKTIADTRASVSVDELRNYERDRNTFSATGNTRSNNGFGFIPR